MPINTFSTISYNTNQLVYVLDECMIWPGLAWNMEEGKLGWDPSTKNLATIGPANWGVINH